MLTARKTFKILVDAPTWYYSRRSTDWLMKVSFVKIISRFVDVRMTDGIIYAIAYNVPYLWAKLMGGLLHREICRICRSIRSVILSLRCVDIVISQGPDPVFPSGVKVIWETYFLEPEQGGDTFCRNGSSFWIKQIESYGNRADLIGVRGTYSKNLLSSMYPEYASKVVDLGFVHREYDWLSYDMIVQKQDRKRLNLLFVGREARRKGLEPFIEALKIVRSHGLQDFTVTIVSTLKNGWVDIPEEDWIIYHKEVSHDEALLLFRDCNLFVMPSYRESYGLVFHEAMANGCVLFVPNREPQREFVDYGKFGMMVDPADLRDLASKIELILTDKEMRIRFAVGGARRYREAFSQERIRSGWLEAFHRLMNDEG